MSISLNLLNYIPVWLKTDTTNRFLSNSLCKDLLPKFLHNNSSPDDIKKAEVILKNLFTIQKVNFSIQNYNHINRRSYFSRISMRQLYSLFNDNPSLNVLNKITTYYSEDIILQLADNLKKLRFDFPDGIYVHIRSTETIYQIRLIIEDKNLNIFVPQEDSRESSNLIIYDFENYTKVQTKQILIDTLKKVNIFIENDELDIAVNGLMNGSHYDFPEKPISKLKEQHYNDDNVIQVFTLIFRDLLNETAKSKHPNTVKILRIFATDNNYRLPIFKRIILFVISENWDFTKELFWEMLNNDDRFCYFTKYEYKKDLYELLNKNQNYLTKDEINILQQIINIGSQETKKYNNENTDYWKHHWYSALREIKPFKKLYDKTSTSLNITSEHHESIGEFKYRVGSISPFSEEEILQKSNQEIVNYIQNFNPKNEWDEPSISGLADILRMSVEKEPQRFSDEIELYNEIYYVYANEILRGFSEAWKNNKKFNWQKVLTFCKLYIENF
jgi:hypothetical protein